MIHVDKCDGTPLGARTPMAAGNAEPTDDQEHDKHTTETDDVERSTTDFRHDPICRWDDAKQYSIVAQSEAESENLSDFGLFEEIDDVARKRVAAKILSGESHTRNLGTASVGASETVQPARTL